MGDWKTVVVVILGILVGIFSFSFFQRMAAGESPGPATPSLQSEPTGEGEEALQEAEAPTELRQFSPKTRIAASRFRCVCGCPNDLLTCNCSEVPGGLSMKIFLQGLVDRGLTNEDIDREMIARYGEEVLLFSPAFRKRRPVTAAGPSCPKPLP